MISRYENLKLKNEFIQSLSSYTLCIFKGGDINRIKDLLQKYSLLSGTYKNDQFNFNDEETVDNLLFYLDQEGMSAE